MSPAPFHDLTLGSKAINPRGFWGTSPPSREFAGRRPTIIGKRQRRDARPNDSIPQTSIRTLGRGLAPGAGWNARGGAAISFPDSRSCQIFRSHPHARCSRKVLASRQLKCVRRLGLRGVDEGVRRVHRRPRVGEEGQRACGLQPRWLASSRSFRRVRRAVARNAGGHSPLRTVP